MDPKSPSDSLEHRLQIIRHAAEEKFCVPSQYSPDGELTVEGNDVSVMHTFDDVIILREWATDSYLEAPYTMQGDVVAIGDATPVQEQFVSKRLSDSGILLEDALVVAEKHKIPAVHQVAEKSDESTELGGPIVFKNSTKRIAYAAVLVPGEPDSDDDLLTAEKIEEVAHGWMEHYRTVDYMHTLNNTGVPVESFILPMTMKVSAYGEEIELPQGSWLLASKLNEESWKGVETGKLTGYSVMGVKRSMFDVAMKSADYDLDAAMKRTTLRDLGDDWVACSVAVVTEPAVPKAKFYAFKSKELAETEPPTFFARVASKLGLKADTVSEKEGRKFSQTTYTRMKAMHEELTALLEEAETEREAKKSVEPDEGSVEDMDKNEVLEAVTTAVKEVVDPLVERVTQLETAAKAESQTPVEEPVAKTAEAPAAEPAVKVESEDEAKKEAETVTISREEYEGLQTFKSETSERLEVLEKQSLKGLTVSKAMAADGSEKPSVTDEETLDHRDAFGRRINK